MFVTFYDIYQFANYDFVQIESKGKRKRQINKWYAYVFRIRIEDAKLDVHSFFLVKVINI